MGLVALGIGVGLGLAAYRHLPPMPEQVSGIVVVVWVLGMVAAYLGGRRHVQQQWQLQIQEQTQLQDQEQTQQQAVVIQVLDPQQAAQVAGGVPALAGDPATPLSSALQQALQEARSGALESSSRPEAREVVERASRP
jgi:hypothetical protein